MMTNEFKIPDRMYHGTDFWMINDKLTEDELLFQLREMADKGTKNILVRTYSGLISDYPGEKFKNNMHFVVKQAERLGLKVYLQAKYMPECIPNIPQKYAMHYLTPKATCDVKEQDIVVCTHGDIQICITASNSVVDLLDECSVDYYIKDCYEDMWSDFKAYYGNTVPSIWVDEPTVGRKYPPFPKNFDVIFKEEYGYDFFPEVYKLWFEEGNYQTVRYHYRTLLQKRMEDCYFKRLKLWCSKNNLWFSGHLLGEDNLKDQIRLSIACMPFYKYFDVPGIDILTMLAEWNTTPIKQKSGDEYADKQRLYTTPAQIMSAVTQAGNDAHVLCEMYGVTTEHMTFKNQMHLFDHMASFGVNHRSVHGIFYSLRGRRKRGYAPHINYYQPYWSKYKNVYDYCARVSRFVRFGKPITDVLILHPLETAYTMMNELLPGSKNNSKIDRFDRFFYDLVINLKANHIEFDFGDFATMRDLGKVTSDGRLQVGRMTYKTVILPDLCVLSTEVYKLLKAFSDMGGKIICIGDAPNLLDGYRHSFDDELNLIYVQKHGYVLELAQYSDAYTLTGTDNAVHILTHCRKGGDTYYFMLFNTDCAHKKEIVLKVNGKMLTKCWNAENGDVAEVYSEYDGTHTVFKGTLDAGVSMLLSFEPGTHSIAQPAVPKIQTMAINENWNVKRDQDNALLLEYCRYKTGNADYSEEMPVLVVNELLFREGVEKDITLLFEFESKVEISGLKLALEDAEKVEVCFNGMSAENVSEEHYIDKSMRVIKLAQACKVGKNSITIHRTYTPLVIENGGLASIFANSRGTELECMYLLGNFAVKGYCEHNLNGCIRMNRRFTISSESGHIKGCDITTTGYPFYVGTAELVQAVNVPLTKACKGVYLRINGLNAAAAELFVNGVHMADISRGETLTDCTEAVTKGVNEIKIKLFGTLRNAFGPSHRPIGERGNTFCDTPSRGIGCYGYFDEPWIPMDTSVPGWYNCTDYDTSLWTPSYNLVPFGADGISLELHY